MTLKETEDDKKRRKEEEKERKKRKAKYKKFSKEYKGYQKWVFNHDHAQNEIDIIDDKKKYSKERYPQGRKLCKEFLNYCKEKECGFKVVLQKTYPYWSWYFEAIGEIE